MKDRTGETWEIDVDLSTYEKHGLIYIIVDSQQASLRDTDGIPSTAHCFLSVEDGTTSTWWERDTDPFERSLDRRRLA